MENSWKQITEGLKLKLQPTDYRVWIASLRAEISDSALSSDMAPSSASLPKRLTIYAHSDYVLSTLKKRFSYLIIDEAKLVLGTDIELDFKIFNDEAESMLPLSAKSLAKELVTAPSVLATSSPSLSEQAVFDLPLPTVHLSTQDKMIQGWQGSFENFIVGPSNQLAYAAAQDIIKPNSSTEMLFLSSSSGLGKTHLTQALGKALNSIEAKKKPSILYLNSERFVSQFIHASHSKELPSFKERFNSLDVLLLEDVHFLCKKEKSQEELLNIIKNLQDRGKKVVFTSSFARHELEGLDSQLTSRFCSGFVASIDYPDFETKKAMLMHKAAAKDFDLPESVANLFAERLDGDIRLLESSLRNLILHAQVAKKPINEEIAYTVLSEIAPKNPHLSLESLVSLVSSYFGISKEDMCSKIRKDQFVVARNVAFYLFRKNSTLTLEEIGKHFNKRHSTVSKAICIIEEAIQKDTRLGAQYKHAIDSIERNYK